MVWWLFLLGLPVLVAATLTAYESSRVERLVPPMGRFIDTASGRIHYVDRGRGSTIVLIHGLGGNLRNFDYGLIDRLAKDHRVIALDRPGSGYSTRTGATPPGPRGDAQAIVALLKRLDVHRPLIVGHSYGGAVALAMATEHPQAVAGLVLLAPLSRSRRTTTPGIFAGLAMQKAWQRWLVSRLVAVPLIWLDRGGRLRAAFAPDPVPTDYGTRGGALLSRRPSVLSTMSLDFVSLTDDLKRLSDGYKHLDVPVSIIFGRHDRVLDHRVHGIELAQALPDATLELVDVGHFLPVIVPDACEHLIRNARLVTT